VQGFAEEMNKCRRMVALGARALAAAGWATLEIDLAGCGDSGGEFEDARWADWIDDALAARDFLAGRIGVECGFWGTRAGCLIAGEASERLGGTAPLLLWQPVLSGKTHLTQFLRLKVASEAIGPGAAERSTTRALRSRLAGGETIEIAGYPLHPALAEGLESAELTLAGQRAPVTWREVGTNPESGLPGASRSLVEALRGRNVAVDAEVVDGPPFWQTVEIAEAPALVSSTVAALAS